MLSLKLNSVLPRKARVFLMIITSHDKIIDVILSDKDHQGTELTAFHPYRIFYLDISSGSLSSVSFFSSDLPHETISLPLFKDINDDFFNSENNENKVSEVLTITTSMNDMINPYTEEDLRYSVDNQYKIDEEPLIEMSNSISIPGRESVVNGLFLTQNRSYKAILNNEKQQRTKYEIILEESEQKYERKMKDFHTRELEILKELTNKDTTIHTLNGEILELKQLIHKLIIEKQQESDYCDKLKLEIETFKKTELQKELIVYKDLVENMNNS